MRSFATSTPRSEKYLRQGLPVISVDTKKKELIGNYENKGRRGGRPSSPSRFKATTSPAPRCPAPIPTAFTTSAAMRASSISAPIMIPAPLPWPPFAAGGARKAGASIRCPPILITADGGGSNGWRLRLWKLELQRLADQMGLRISVCHFPPGTSKWNKIEHRLFSFISSNWRGEPLRDYETIVHLIANTTTAKGLTVTCRLDRRKYPTGAK